MRILFAITALCLIVLLWAGLAIRRHILAAARERQQRRDLPPVAKAYEVELKQELRTAHIQSGFFGGISDPQPARHISRVRPSLRDSAVRASVTAVPIFEPEERPEPPTYQPVPVAEATPEIAIPNQQPVRAEYRKPPVSIQTGEFKRLDLGQYKDPGDLSDPYQIPRTSTRNRS
jgi:hypothetical protein